MCKRNPFKKLPGVNIFWSPNAPIKAKTAYGVQEATNKKHTVIAALAIRTSTDWAWALQLC